MAIRVAMIGYGAVGAIHAAKLRMQPDVEVVSVYGPKRDKAALFASAHAIPRSCDSFAEAVSGAAAAIICSPSKDHFEQACECLRHGVHTLVELPPCENGSQAEELAHLAQRSGVNLGCAHTARFVEPYARVGNAIKSGVLGEIQTINFMHGAKLRQRSWKDDALQHHAAHAVDLMFCWCGGIEPKGCVTLPDARLPQTVSVLGTLPSGGAVTITVTYALCVERLRAVIVGQKHNMETDGFSYVDSDLSELEFRGDAEETYHEAIYLQDVEFLRACQGTGRFVGWSETLRVFRTIDDFRALGGSGGQA